MPALWYRAALGLYPRITQINVTRETHSTLYVNGARFSKQNTFEKHFQTWEEAHACLVSLWRSKEEMCVENLMETQETLNEVLNMKPPA